ncbi:MAG: M81 family metallopeptidase [Paracoccus sp. (in: a-proteobacteria)]
MSLPPGSGEGRTRIFTASLAIETNTFSPVPTDMQSFRAAFYAGPGAHPDTPTLYSSVVPILRRRGQAEGFTVIEGTLCWAEPAGLIQRQTYEILRDQTLGELRAALPVDGVVLGLHGAMVAQGYDDPRAICWPGCAPSTAPMCWSPPNSIRIAI